MERTKQKIDRIFERTTKTNQIHEAVLFVENMDGDFSYGTGYGGKNIDTPFLMASITKLFTTACILILKEQGKLSLDDEVAKYLTKDTLSQLHMYKRQDYSTGLILSNLLFQTSGLPDIFEEGSNKAKKRAIYEDRQFNFDDKIAMTKQLKPDFVPGTGKRAHYSNINFDLLGEIIETVTDSTLEDVYQQFIFDPLELRKTCLLKSDDDVVPAVYYKDIVLYRPKFIRSSRASGGGISTARELMIFLKSFFGGKLFNQTIFNELKTMNKLQVSMYPIQYGAGFMIVPLSGLATLFTGKGELVGHSGSTGSFAFYHPMQDIFFVGDVNQMANPALPIRLAMRLAVSVGS
ncbi:serine hydrolase domain-containing protein [Sporosarcina newyorkensis]|uniref:CubicO group peptidase, beta-lactamase class C family n=1 Tax=Sporosarcina newyorkensis TaxID=759851 RepID=A0A1T4XI23_9BACL|nr:serine hydrolase domain-containing protein [Sporosarcina newyorkensis]SKA89200.1 CubicO group peptidase, beta-lactamase class C family [Sporosarcina newyorkensis]